MCRPRIWDPDLDITVPADGLAPDGARPSAGTVLSERSGMFLFLWWFHWISMILCNVIGLDDVIQIGRRDFMYCAWGVDDTHNDKPLQWRHNERDDVSNHRRLDSLLIRLFKKVPRHWPLWGESTGDWWIPTQRASNAKNDSIWCHHAITQSRRRDRGCILWFEMWFMFYRYNTRISYNVVLSLTTQHPTLPRFTSGI